MRNPSTPKATARGVVTARACTCCGHHEIGILTDTGEYIPLRPGMRVTVTIPSAQHEGMPADDP